MAEQEYEVGSTIGSQTVTAVSYQETEEGEKYNFNYTLRPTADLEREAQEEKDRIRTKKRLEAEAKKVEEAELARQKQAEKERLAAVDAKNEAIERGEDPTDPRRTMQYNSVIKLKEF